MVAGPAGHLRVHEGQVHAVAQGRVGSHWLDLLGHRGALAGEGRFVDLQGGGADEPSVRGDEVAGLDHDDVARDQLLHGHLSDGAVAEHAGLDDHHALEGGDARLRLAFLVQTHEGIEERQADEQDAGPELPGQEEAQDARPQEHDLHRILVLTHERSPTRLPGGLGELVRPVLRAARVDLGGGQPLLRVDTLTRDGVRHAEGMPGDPVGRPCLLPVPLSLLGHVRLLGRCGPDGQVRALRPLLPFLSLPRSPLPPLPADAPGSATAPGGASSTRSALAARSASRASLLTFG